MVEHVKKAATSTTAKTALGLGIGALGLNALGLGGLGGNLLGGGASPIAVAAATGGGYVTEKEMCLIRESSGKDATIARLEAEKYADAVVKAEVAPLNARICQLETATAVNAARDHDFRHYVEREFVHQPKARMTDCIVTTAPCACCCTPATPATPAI